MAPRKTERIVNLTICLLAAPRFLTREQIREAVEGYAGLSDAAFERTFERDKDELRQLGVPVETGSNSAYFDDEVGYRISRRDFELPPVEFTPAEAAAVSVAGRVWTEANLAESTQVGLAKLRAAGLEADPGRVTRLAPTVAAREAAFEPLWQAVLDTTRMSFGYRRPRGEPQRRTVEPWGIVSSKGHWYLIGHDVDRDATRMFKLARIIDTPVPVSEPGAYAVPEDLDLRAMASRLEPEAAGREAELALRSGRIPWLRRRGRPVAASTSLPGGFETIAVTYADQDAFAAELASYGSDVVVIAPAELRAGVRRQLTGVAGVDVAAHRGAAPGVGET